MRNMQNRLLVLATLLLICIFNLNGIRQQNIPRYERNFRDGQSSPVMASFGIIGSYDTTGTAHDVAISGDVAFICDDTAGLVCVNISDPTSPTWLSTYNSGNITYAVKVIGNLAYVAYSNGGLKILNVSDPRAPSPLGSYTYLSPSQCIDVQGDVAYLGCSAYGLRCINVSNPNSPALLGTCGAGNPYNVVVKGGIAHIAGGGMSNSYHLLNVSNPKSPFEVGVGYGFNAKSVDVQGDLAVTSGDQTGINLLNISNPSSPYLIKNYMSPPNNVLGVTISGDLLYSADTSNGLWIYNISNPANPSIPKKISVPGNPQRLVVRGDLAFIAAQSAGLQIVKISKIIPPKLYGTYDTTGNAQTSAVHGDTLFVADGTQGLTIFDFTVPGNPTYLTSFPSTGNITDLEISGDLLFYANGSVVCLNIADPRNPIYVSQYDGPLTSRRIDVEESKVYVAAAVAGVICVDFSTPTSPSLCGQTETLESARDLDVEGDEVYVSMGSAGIAVLNVTTPQIITNLTQYDTSGTAECCRASGNRLLVADGEDGLLVLNISDPMSLTPLTTMSTAGYARDLSIQGFSVFISEGTEGCQIVNITDIFNPQNQTKIPTSYTCSYIECFNDIAIISQADYGISVYKIRLNAWESPQSPSLNEITPSESVTGEIYLEWTGVDYVESYQVYRYPSVITNLNASVISIANTTDTFFTDILFEEGAQYYVVVAQNEAGVSPISNCQGVIFNMPDPSAPNLNTISPSSSINGTIQLIWTSGEMVDNFTVYRYDKNITEVNGSLTNLTTTTLLTYTDQVNFEGMYYYAIIATNESGNSNVSNCVAILVDFPGPATVIVNEINPPLSTTGNVNISWSAVPSAMNYSVYRSIQNITEMNSSAILLSTTEDLYYLDNNLWDRSYYYVVFANNVNGSSNMSNCVWVVVDLPDPDAPVLQPIDPPVSTNGSIKLIWNSVPMASNYSVARWNGTIINLNGSLYYAHGITATSYVDNVPWEGRWFYVVIAVNETGISDLSNCENVTVDLPNAMAPILQTISPNPRLAGNVTLRWNEDPLVFIYYIYWGTTCDPSLESMVLIATSFSPNFTIYLPEAGHYHFIVVALNATGLSLPSNCIEVIVQNENNSTSPDLIPYIIFGGGGIAIAFLVSIAIWKNRHTKRIDPSRLKSGGQVLKESLEKSDKPSNV